MEIKTPEASFNEYFIGLKNYSPHLEYSENTRMVLFEKCCRYNMQSFDKLRSNSPVTELTLNNSKGFVALNYLSFWLNISMRYIDIRSVTDPRRYDYYSPGFFFFILKTTPPHVKHLPLKIDGIEIKQELLSNTLYYDDFFESISHIDNGFYKNISNLKKIG